MPRSTFRAVLAGWTLALVAATLAAVGAVATAQSARLAREEAMARAERGLERGLEALARGLDPGEFEVPDGVSLRRVDGATIDAEFVDSRVGLWRSALDGSRATARISGVGAVAARALPDGGGVLEATVSQAAIDAQVRRFVSRFVSIALPLLLAAVAASMLVAARLARPISELDRAAAGLAAGDLDTPLPRPAGAEVGALAATLESMRIHLNEATGELERRRGELEAVLASVSEGVFAVDRDRRVRYLSPRAEQLLGVASEDAVGRFCGDVLRPALVDGERPCDTGCPILQARSRGPMRATERLQVDGRELVARLSSSPPAGGIQVQIVREETAEEAARAARDAVVADLAHELKTPLAAQRASLELLRERLATTDAESEELALATEAGALRLERLIDNLLESVRIESGETSLRRLPVDLDEVVEEATGTMLPLLAKRGQSIETALPYPLPTLTGDPQRLGQVLVNLLANASKFAPAGSIVRIGGEIAGEALALWVEDEGPGFDTAALSRLGRRFRRGGAGEAGEPREAGTGLGLWIARSIAERHGGALEVGRVDGRTRVAMRLPLSGSSA
jgi:signal transduction histidine kinase